MASQGTNGSLFAQRAVPCVLDMLSSAGAPEWQLAASRSVAEGARFPLRLVTFREVVPRCVVELEWSEMLGALGVTNKHRIAALRQFHAVLAGLTPARLDPLFGGWCK